MTLSIAEFTRAALIGASLVALTPAANAAATLTYQGGIGGLSAGQTDYANFDSTFGSVATTGTTGVYTGTSGNAAEPNFGDQGDAYFAVGNGGSATFSFGAGVTSFGFDLGSADNFNSVLVTFVGGATQLFVGAQLNPPGPASGNQSVPGTNGRVTIFGNDLGQIASARFGSTGTAFEFDNIGVAAVPEPGTWAMMILGFGLVGGAMRRRSALANASRMRLTYV